MEIALLFGTAIGLIILANVIVIMVVKRFYVKVDQGQVLVINTTQRMQVSTTGGIVYPIICKAETMDVTLKTIEIRLEGKTGLVCADNIRANLVAQFMVRINPTEADILTVAQAVGCERAGSLETMTELFGGKFGEALKTAGAKRDFADLGPNLEVYREEVIQLIGRNLNGYILEDVVIANVEQTPISDLDPQNLLDAQGIRKITETTSVAAARVNELQRNSELQLRRYAKEHPEVVRQLASYLQQ